MVERRASRGGGVIRITRCVRVAGIITNTVVVTCVLLVRRSAVSVGAGEPAMRNTGVIIIRSGVSSQHRAHPGAGIVTRHRGGTTEQAAAPGRCALGPAGRLLVRLS